MKMEPWNQFFSKIKEQKEEQKLKSKNDSFAVILSEAKNLSFVGQILRLRLRMTRKCHFSHFKL